MDQMESRGHKIFLAVKERENTTRLLDLYGRDYAIFGKTYPNRPAKAWGILANDLRLLMKVHGFKPDLTMSIAGLYSVHAGAIMGVPSIDFMDTEGAGLTNMVTFPFANVIATPDCYRGKVPKDRHRPYPGYHELAYLHPKRYTPDPSILEDLELKKRDYIVIRFSSLDASHQEKEGVMTAEEKVQLVHELNQVGEVLVDSEYPLPEPLKPYGLHIEEHRYHDLLAHAGLYVGEGATAASEAGVLGVPWIYISGNGRCYLEEQEKEYGLGRKVDSYPRALTSAKEMYGKDLADNRKRLLKDKIDVTSWMIDLAEELL